VRYAWFGWIMAAVVIVEVAGVVLTKQLGIDVTRGAAPLPADYSNTRELGALLYGHYSYPLEIAAMLLLVAMVAAITLTLRHRAGLKAQDINKQVAARASERVRIVKMKPEQKP
jgi:NADH-quinone oxidoreductase subunit J